MKIAGTMIVINFGYALVTVLFKKALDEGANQMAIVAYRLAVCTIFLTPIAYFRERNTRTKLTATLLCYLFFGALIGITLGQYLFLLGLEYTSAAFSCAFLNTVPVNTFLLAIPFGLEKVKLGRKSGRAKVLGAVICMAGAVLLTLYKGSHLNNSHDNGHGTTAFAPASSEDQRTMTKWVVGSLLLIGGCLSWSSWFLIQAQILKRYPCPYSITLFLSSFAAVQTASLTLIVMKRDDAASL